MQQFIFFILFIMALLGVFLWLYYSLYKTELTDQDHRELSQQFRDKNKLK